MFNKVPNATTKHTNSHSSPARWMKKKMQKKYKKMFSLVDKIVKLSLSKHNNTTELKRKHLVKWVLESSSLFNKNYDQLTNKLIN